MRSTFAAVTLLGLCAVSGPSAGQGAAPALGLPIACRPGVDCFVQNHFDHDPGPAAKDHRCGSATYDGHDGIDIRLPTTAAMRRGVAVVASAAGVVRGVRDGVEDRAVTSAADRAAVSDRECGNGVAVTHAGGWETQYCHMRRGSVVVREGQAVAAGEKLGEVGLSGWTQFPHAHITVRQGGKAVDPFTGGTAACGQAGRLLWAPQVAAALAYRSPQVINAGFAAGPVEMAAVEADVVPRPTRASPALVAYVRTIGIEAGDRIDMVLTTPDGRELARQAVPPFDRPKAQQLNFIGGRLKTAAWSPGRYKLTYRITRGGKVVLDRTVETTL